MSASLASFKPTVEELIRRFESDRVHYLSKDFSEAQARVDFITPFFKALGWDGEKGCQVPFLFLENTMRKPLAPRKGYLTLFLPKMHGHALVRGGKIA